ncbi:hypothetical protein BCR42DRAFT_392182 [Absidia repens]|uniref:Uncharacterized protein n=1 Tax=Absidia repens TaxID=90262 RepID=A0A1X2IGI2_9FUNG|nr:hypothetical protein BCR42DRAFT_392182 [Absidia repens]
MHIRHQIQLLYLLLCLLPALFLTWPVYLYSDTSLASAERRAAKAMEFKIFHSLADQQGVNECQNMPWFFAGQSYLHDAPPFWTSASTLKKAFMPPQSYGDFVMEDRIDLALDYLRDHPHVIYWVKDDDMYFSTEVSTYSIQCKINKFLLWIVDLIGGFIL